MAMFLTIDDKMMTMKKKFNYDPRQKKILVELTLIILVLTSIYGWFNKPFLAGFSDGTFMAGLILCTICAIRTTYDDHTTFKKYAQYARETDRPVGIDAYKQNNITDEKPSGDVLLGLALIILIIGILSTLLVILV